MYQQLGQHHVSSKSECQYGFKSLVLFKHEGQPLLTPRVDDIFLPCSPVIKFYFSVVFFSPSCSQWLRLQWPPLGRQPEWCVTGLLLGGVAGRSEEAGCWNRKWTHLAQEHHLLECRLGGCLRGRINIGSNVQLYSCNMYMVWWIFVCHSQHSSSGLDRHFSRQ